MSTESNHHLEPLLVALKESLEREMHSVRAAMQAGFATINERFDRQGARMDRQASSIQVGARWMTRHETWSEKIDKASETDQTAIAALVKEMAELRTRVEKLEGANGR